MCAGIPWVLLSTAVLCTIPSDCYVCRNTRQDAKQQQHPYCLIMYCVFFPILSHVREHGLNNNKGAKQNTGEEQLPVVSLYFFQGCSRKKGVGGVERNLKMRVPPTQFYLFVYGTVHMKIPGNTPHPSNFN